jgi:hypothetical protein
MPAKPKSKKSVKSYVRKKTRKAPPRASFSPPPRRVATTAGEEADEATAPPSSPVLPEVSLPVVPTPVAPEAPKPVAPPPVSEPVTNLEQILDTDMKDSAVEVKNRVVFSFGIITALAIIAGAIIVFVIYLGSSKAPKPVTQKATVTPTATPTPAFTRAAITFEVVNASGVSGAATKGAATLTQAGYTVVSVGNGKKQATSSLLLIGSLTSVEVSEILADVNSLFSISSSSGDLTDSTASARIILGSK